MSILSLSLFALGCAVLAFLGWAIVAGGNMRQVEQETDLARPKRVYIRGLCVYCGEVVVLRQDGEPHARFHSCPGMTQVVTTWPPEKTEAV